MTLDQGRLYPFFVKRVLNFTIYSLGELLDIYAYNAKSKAKRSLLRTFLFLLRIFSFGRVFLDLRSSAKTDIRVCKSCGFVGPEVYWDYESLKNLYVDYRSSTYNAERTIFEPNYGQIKHLVGKSDEETHARLRNMDTLVEKFIDTNRIKNVMDWGGAQGAFIPTILQDKKVWILDLSNEPLINPKYTRVDKAPEDVKFDYLQICHVLEHVISPHNFMLDILPHLSSGGIIYIEVPQDRPDEDLKRFLDSDPTVNHGIHEHLNLFNEKSIRALAQSLGLQSLTVKTREIEHDWSKGTIVCGLFIKY